MSAFWTMMAVQFISYLNLTINFRAIAHGQIGVAMVTDALSVAIGIYVVKRLAGVQVTWTAQETGMVIGGSAAAAVGMALTRAWG